MWPFSKKVDPRAALDAAVKALQWPGRLIDLCQALGGISGPPTWSFGDERSLNQLQHFESVVTELIVSGKSAVEDRTPVVGAIFGFIVIGFL